MSPRGFSVLRRGGILFRTGDAHAATNVGTEGQVLTSHAGATPTFETAVGGGGGAPDAATYIVQVPHAGLSAEQPLSALATGLVKNTTTTGVLSIGVANTDYAAAAHASRHENAGADEISVLGLSGLLADAQTPLAHATSHKSGGTDAVKLDELAAPTDVATLNASTSAHGLLKKLSNIATEFMNGQGAWAVPTAGAPLAHATSHKSGGSDVVALDELAAPTDIATLNASTTAHGLLKKLSNVATEYMNGQGAWTVPAGGGSGWDQEIYKAADQDVVANTTLQNDTHLLFAVTAGEAWEIEFILKYSGNATGTDMKVNAAFPSANGQYNVLSTSISDAIAALNVTVRATTTLTTFTCATRSALTTAEILRVSAILVFTASGNFQVQHANQVSGTTRVMAGSVLRGRLLAP
jgi:hypothetical protein